MPSPNRRRLRKAGNIVVKGGQAKFIYVKFATKDTETIEKRDCIGNVLKAYAFEGELTGASEDC